MNEKSRYDIHKAVSDCIYKNTYFTGKTWENIGIRLFKMMTDTKVCGDQ